MVEPLIKLKRTFEESMSFKDSPMNQIYIFRGVQLLPNNPTKYVQVTDIEDGINLENWTVYAVSLKSGLKTDITDSFNVESLTNSDDGSPQIYWSLQNVEVDFGYDCIYLEVEQTFGETFYSNPFMITDYKKERTTQFHYKTKKNDVMQSISMQSYFRQIQRSEELTQYYETSTSTTVSVSQKLNKLEKHYTEIMPLEILDLLMDILSSPFMYVDGIRASLYETPKMPDLSASQNFGQIEFLISPKKWDIYSEPQPSKGDWLASDWLSTDWKIYTP
jgi:hypothetical protein